MRYPRDVRVMHLGIVLLTLLCWTGSLLKGSFLDEQAVDFYPQWFAARLILDHHNPYSDESNQLLRHSWLLIKTTQVPVTTAYPLPALLVHLPFGVLPFTVARIIWDLLQISTVFLACWYSAKRGAHFIVPLLFLPLFRAVAIHQVSVLWFGATLVLLMIPPQRYSIWSGLLAAILPWKPQAGLCFFFFFLWRNRKDKLFIISTGLWLALLLSLSFFVMPNWVSEWLRVCRETWVSFSRLGLSVSLLPIGLIMLVPTLKLTPLAFVATLQVILFPINDYYGALPLLLAWLELRKINPGVGCSLSLLAPVLYTTWNSLVTLWALVLFPFFAFCCAELRERGLIHASHSKRSTI